ncbi:hypothetical protein [Deinococcus soli (ex Cha et al. 2016)]|uniref:Transposase n=1 Tax=Deinococcus soli (ex Cha et al. 2016) TaxID=1309411 RepID=A0A0F7JKX5_9DEIO|nr:hypothetical protein [Deinococcus soli (ex Cha et al. 2016)]AKH15974.1 hypothetical protein SY84_01705 [Deinococcus soli (ex Cha et al. 2016)]
MSFSDRRIGQPVTFAAALGVREGETLELNRPTSATCPRCGQEPRLHHHVSPKGRDITVWIPVEHYCRPS